jgi:hypothetical protein
MCARIFFSLTNSVLTTPHEHTQEQKDGLVHVSTAGLSGEGLRDYLS